MNFFSQRSLFFSILKKKKLQHFQHESEFSLCQDEGSKAKDDLSQSKIFNISQNLSEFLPCQDEGSKSKDDHS